MMKLPALHWQIAIALLLAVVIGINVGPDSAALSVFQFIGKFFLNALKMLIVPLIVASIIAAMVNLGSGSAFGRLGLKTLAYYVLTSAIAVITGLLLVNMIAPGVVDGLPGAEALGMQGQDTANVEASIAGRSSSDVVDVFLRMVPPNIVAAAAEGQMLGLIVFSLLFGFFISRLPEAQRRAQTEFWSGLNSVMLHMTDFVMKLAPLGVFGLVAAVAAESPDFLKTMQQLSVFAFTVLAALGIHLLITMPLLLRFLGGVSPLAHFRVMTPVLLTAFSTASSSATLPLTMETVSNDAGVSRKTAGFVLPLGATINMDGTALYECIVVLFIAQAYGVDMSLAQQLMVVLLALVTSIGVAGIPSASLVAITLILSTFGLPLEGIAVIWIFDRLLDMCRTAVNVFSDSCGAVIIARSEGEQTKLASNNKLGRQASNT